MDLYQNASMRNLNELNEVLGRKSDFREKELEQWDKNIQQQLNYFQPDSKLKPNYLLMNQELMNSRSLLNYPNIFLANIEQMETYQDKIKDNFDIQNYQKTGDSKSQSDIELIVDNYEPCEELLNEENKNEDSWFVMNDEKS